MLAFSILSTDAMSRSHATLVNRVVAKSIDIGIVFTLALILPHPLGPLLGFAYSLLADGINRGAFKGQSVGKKLMKLQVVHQSTRKPATFRESALRNAPVGVATFFAIIPFWGWIILALIGLPLMLVEIYLMARVEAGHRLGDVMGDTEVIDLKNAT